MQTRLSSTNDILTVFDKRIQRKYKGKKSGVFDPRKDVGIMENTRKHYVLLQKGMESLLKTPEILALVTSDANDSDHFDTTLQGLTPEKINALEKILNDILGEA